MEFSALPASIQYIINFAVFLATVIFAIYTKTSSSSKKTEKMQEPIDSRDSINQIADELVKIREVLTEIVEMLSDEIKEQSISREVERRINERKRGAKNPIDNQGS